MVLNSIMLSPERGFDPSFQPEIKYTDPTLAPIVVAQKTSTCLDMFIEQRIDAPFARGYLADKTLPFLNMARDGLIANFPRLREIGRIDPETLKEMVASGFDLRDTADPEKTEAFGHSIITMGLLPSMAKHSQLPDGFSKIGLLAPPTTIAEYKGRMHELRTTIIGLATRTIPRSKSVLNNPALCRTYYFFDVGSRIPLKENDEGTLLNEMLEGIKIDL